MFRPHNGHMNAGRCSGFEKLAEEKGFALTFYDEKYTALNEKIKAMDSAEKAEWIVKSASQNIWETETTASLVISNSSEEQPSEKTSEEPTKEISEDESEPSSEKTDMGQIDPDFKEALDSYEQFIDEYIVFMRKYQNGDPTSLELIAEMAEYTEKMADFEEKMGALEKDMNPAEQQYYTEVMTRIGLKMAALALTY